MENTKAHWMGTISDSSSLSLDYIFPPEILEKTTKEDREKMLTRAISLLSQKMAENGQVDFMSAQDISKKFGNSRQYWDKLMSEGKIPYKQTSAGKITTHLWVKGFIEGGEEYVKNMMETRAIIIERYKQHKHGYGTIRCPQCKREDSLIYYCNQGYHINGLCRECGFQIDTQE